MLQPGLGIAITASHPSGPKIYVYIITTHSIIRPKSVLLVFNLYVPSNFAPWSLGWDGSLISVHLERAGRWRQAPASWI
jgi:hypothetical protein